VTVVDGPVDGDGGNQRGWSRTDASKTPKPTGAVETDLCALILEPHANDGRIVRLRANVVPGGHYEMMLHRAECSQKAVVLFVPSSLQDDERVALLRELVFAGFPKVRSTEVQVQLAGQFRWFPDQVPTRVLSLVEIIAIDEQSHEE
jgi:hypothetical protein